MYVDSYENLIDGIKDEKEKRKGRNILLADAEQPPFPQHVFDAVFIQDLHPDPDGFEEILSTLKPDGILIFSTDDCGALFNGELQLTDVQRHQSLKKLDLPFYTRYYTAFQKVNPASNKKR